MWFSPAAWGAGSPTWQDHTGTGTGASQPVLYLLGPQKKRHLVQKVGSPAHGLQISRMVLTRQATRSFCGLSVPKSGLRSKNTSHRCTPAPAPASNGLDLGPHVDAVFLVGHRGLVIRATRWRLILGLLDLARSGVEGNVPVCQGDPSPWGTDVCICSSCPLSFGCFPHEVASARVPSRWA